jgi:D-amino-acid dehydrogenase
MTAFAEGIGVRVLVLGAGVVGTTCAWYLREAGHEVIVVDRQAGAARETSLANGGQISTSHSEPWANPGAPRRILGWLGREEAPLLFRPRVDLQQWLWALAFLRECLPARTAANIRAIVSLALHSRTELKALRTRLALDYDCVQRGILHFYTDRAEFEASLAPAALMRELGCDRRSITADEAVALEPALASITGEIVGADYCAEDESGDAHAFTVQLAEHAAAREVEFRFGMTVTRLLTNAQRCTGIEALDPEGWPLRIDADAVVVALGVHSVRLLRPLGIRVPVYPGKGYSATYEVLEPDRAPIVSLTDDEYKLVFSRLGNRLRVAGTAELGADGRDLNPARCEVITRRTRQLFPAACDYLQPRYWAGLRPMTPSNVPCLGATRMRGLFLNTGHGTLGWTLAAGSGQLIADLVSGRPTEIPLRAFAA